MTSPDESRAEVQENAALVSNAEHVQHAEVVTNSAKTDIATVVSHADNVGIVEVHGESLRSDKTRRLAYIREILRWFVVLFALLVMIITIFSKNASEKNLIDDLQTLRNERSVSDKITADKLECVRRYQDAIDQNTESQLILIGEFLVTITQIPPGPDRTAAVTAKINDLAQTNASTRETKKAKVDYNNKGNPLPCPLSPTIVPPLNTEPIPVTVPLTTPTTSIIVPAITPATQP